MAIPARHIRRVVASQALVLDDNVFQNFVERRAHVDIAVSERRAVMKHILESVFPLEDSLIKTKAFPEFLSFRLGLRQISFHRKRGLSDIDG